MRILLATDGSDISLEATRRGVVLLADPKHATLLSVVSDLPLDTGAGGIEGPIYTPEQQEELLKEEERVAAQALADTKAALPPGTSVDHRVETGDPAALICTVAKEIGADVIVVGSHGKGFLSRVLLGSVSEYVTRHAPCPVLVVRPAVEK
jgi:nucleotide-binding universal stress UspA family protein